MMRVQRNTFTFTHQFSEENQKQVKLVEGALLR